MYYKWDIEFDKVGVTYPNGKEALKNIDLKINEGEFISIIGLSGAGKTTLLKTLNLINRITAGNIYVGDKSREALEYYNAGKAKFKEIDARFKVAKSGDVDALKKLETEYISSRKNEDISEADALQELTSDSKLLFSQIKSEHKEALDEYKKLKSRKPYYMLSRLKGKSLREYRTHIGMVFQRYNLIYKSTVLTNVLTAILPTLPWWRSCVSLFTKEEKELALKALAEVNILETAYVRAGDLSGGQMQRVALARTIAQDARVILADEPVGALDPIMAKSVMDSFLKINREQGRTTVMNLHHVELALEYTDRIIGVKAGEIVFDGPAEEVDLSVLKTIYGDKLSGFGKHELAEVARKRKITQEISSMNEKVDDAV